MNRLVNMSNVKTVEQAEKARVDAMNKVAVEKQKIHMAKKNCKEEIAKINNSRRNELISMRRKILFWEIASIATFIAGMIIVHMI